MRSGGIKEVDRFYDSSGGAEFDIDPTGIYALTTINCEPLPGERMVSDNAHYVRMLVNSPSPAS